MRGGGGAAATPPLQPAPSAFAACALIRSAGDTARTCDGRDASRDVKKSRASSSASAASERSITPSA